MTKASMAVKAAETTTPAPAITVVARRSQVARENIGSTKMSSANTPYIATPKSGVGTPAIWAKRLARTSSQPLPRHTIACAGEAYTQRR